MFDFGLSVNVRNPKMNLITHTYKNLNKGSENCFLKYNFNTEKTRKIQHVKFKELEHCWPPCSSFFSKYLERVTLGITL